MFSVEIQEKFKKLYQSKFNVLLTDEEVTQMVSDMVNLMKILLQPEPKENNDVRDEERRQNETIAIQNH